MDVTGTTVVVGMAGRLFHIYDIRKIREGEEPMQRRESSLKFMTRALGCMSDGKGQRAFSSTLHRIFGRFILLIEGVINPRLRHGFSRGSDSGGIF
jgi:hypothetical protein